MKVFPLGKSWNCATHSEAHSIPSGLKCWCCCWVATDTNWSRNTSEWEAIGKNMGCVTLFLLYTPYSLFKFTVAGFTVLQQVLKKPIRILTSQYKSDHYLYQLCSSMVKFSLRKGKKTSKSLPTSPETSVHELSNARYSEQFTRFCVLLKNLPSQLSSHT